jgi:hypothetical protein
VIGERGRNAVLAASGASLLALCSCSPPAAATSGSPSHTRATQAPVPQQQGGIRTVLSPLGLNIHGEPSAGAPVVGVAAQGTLLTVIEVRAGWYRVQGQTVTGWIVDDASLTASGQYTSYQSSRGFSVLYPAGWTFAEEPDDTLFRPQQGSRESIVVRTAVSTAAFGQRGLAGYTQTFEDDGVIVCGYTGTLAEFAQPAGASPPAPPSGSSATPLSLYAEIRLRFDAAHAMQIAFNYAVQRDLGVFADFYNSITFNFPLCELPASPAPT